MVSVNQFTKQVLKTGFIFIFLLNLPVFLFGQNYSDLIDQLEAELEKKEFYIEQKENKIQEIKDELHYFARFGDLHKHVEVCFTLVYEYQSFVYDSAFQYIEKAKNLAYELNDPVLIGRTKTREGFVLLSSGLFKEAIDTLSSIDVSVFNDSLKSDYYSVIARAYYDLADYGRDPFFSVKHIAEGNRYLDSALVYVTPDTNEFWSAESLHRMKESDWSGAKFAFSYWMNNYDLPRHYYAIATSSLGYIHSITGFNDQAIEYLAKAAIADIKTATMETVALRNLSNLLFEKGETKQAYRYIVEALEDANFYNARHRKNEIVTILPIIEGNRLAVVEGQKQRLMFFSIVLFVLAVLVIAFSFIIYKQLTKIRKTRKTLQETVNSLNEINIKLRETNQIKEEYIGYFFNANSDYIEKLEALKKNLQRKVVARQFDELTDFLNNLNMKKEREELFRKFDEIFLRLFPEFVLKYNALFPEEDWVEIKSDDLLNSELRIFALIRLGIHDGDKIARFLNLSVATIYTYKTKAKSKSLYRDNFDEKIMEIKPV